MKGLLQREVADHAGIDRSTYINYESQAHGLYDFAALAKIAALIGVALDDLLDEHNRFVFAQGENLKSLRKQQKLTQARLQRKAAGAGAGAAAEGRGDSALVPRM